MTKITKFEDLDVWKESMRLAESLLNEIADCKCYALKDQIQRSCISVPSNIAEGFERKSNKEYIQHLYIAKGSCAELRTQLYLAIHLKYIKPDSGNLWIDDTRKISAMTMNLIKTRLERFS